jgi:DNA modification methylase
MERRRPAKTPLKLIAAPANRRTKLIAASIQTEHVVVFLSNAGCHPRQVLGLPSEIREITMDNSEPRPPLAVEYLSIEFLQPDPNNARTHSKRQIRKIAKSMRRRITNPISVDEHNNIIAGHGRYLAALSLGMKTIPVIRIVGMGPAERRAQAIFDNQVALDAGWNRAILASEFEALVDLLPLENMDLADTGFDSGAADAIVSDHRDASSEPDDIPPPLRKRAISRHGDLWLLGSHAILCGDARSEANLKRLLMGSSAKMVFADPPYNVPVKGHVSGRGRARHEEFAFASGKMTSAEFVEFLKMTLDNAARVSVDGAVHYVCMDWRHVVELFAAGRAVYAAILNLCVWVKTNGGQGSFYRSQHELIGVFRVGAASHQNNVEMGRHGRSRSNVWHYAGVNSFGSGRKEALEMHPTVKPVALVADAMRDCTTKGDLVLDPFLGSGTTLIAAEKIGRRARGLEYEPRFVDVAIRRWEAYTGRDAILEGHGRTFCEVEAERNSEAVDAPAPATLTSHAGDQ